MKRQEAFADISLVCATGLGQHPPALSLTLSAACAVLSSWRVSSRLALAPCRDLLRPAMSPSLVRTTCRGEQRGVQESGQHAAAVRPAITSFLSTPNRLIV